jgi:hypothetical protein
MFLRSRRIGPRHGRPGFDSVLAPRPAIPCQLEALVGTAVERYEPVGIHQLGQALRLGFYLQHTIALAEVKRRVVPLPIGGPAQEQVVDIARMANALADDPIAVPGDEQFLAGPPAFIGLSGPGGLEAVFLRRKPILV